MDPVIMAGSLHMRGKKMKLSVDHFAIRKRFREKEAFTVLKKAGFDATDFSYFGWPSDDPVLGGEYLSYAREMRQMLDDLGLSCHQCHGPFAYDAHEPMDERSENYVAMERSLRSAAILGADHVTVHSLYVPWVSKEEEWEINRKYFKSFEHILKNEGIRIAIENLPIQCTETPEQIDQMIEELDSPCYAALLDTGHGMISNITPEDFIRRLKPGSLCGVHVQDMFEHRDSHLVPYMGEIDWDAFIKALREVGYQGEMSLEIIHFMEKIPTDLIPAALAYAAQTGRYLIRRFEEA